MRAVTDTNVLLSGLLWHGTQHTLIVHVRAGTLGLVSSPAILSELATVIARPKFRPILARSDTNPALMLAELRRLAEIVDPPTLAKRVSRDPDDDAVLALAVAAQTDFIISGDADLLVLEAYAAIPIMTPLRAVEVIAGGTSR